MIPSKFSPGVWNIDPSHSRVGFAVRRLGLSAVRGEFHVFDGMLEVGDDLCFALASGTVRPASLDTGNERRDEYLRSAAYFEAEAYPAIRFDSVLVEDLGEDTFMIFGGLSMHGMTQEVELIASLVDLSTGEQGEKVMRLKVSGELSRREWGMRLRKAFWGVDIFVSGKVRMGLDIAAVLDEKRALSSV